MRRILSRLVLAVLLLVLLVAGGGYMYLRQSLPDYDSDVTVSGLSGDVDIVRDVADSDNWRYRLSFVFRGPGWAYARRAELDAELADRGAEVVPAA